MLQSNDLTIDSIDDVTVHKDEHNDNMHDVPVTMGRSDTLDNVLPL